MKQQLSFFVMIFSLITFAAAGDWKSSASSVAAPMLFGKWVPQYGIGVDGVGGGNEVHASVENDKFLFVGGRFLEAGGVPSSCVAGYDKTTKEWFSLAGGVTFGFSNFLTVNALALHGDTLYVGGQFTQAGGNGAGNIARWIIPDRRWDFPKELSFSINSGTYVHAMHVRGDSIFIAGANTGGISVWNVIEQKRTTISAGGSISGTVYSVTSDANNIYAVGDFNQVSGTTSPRAVRFSLTERKWFSMGSGFTGRATAIVKKDTMLYAAGQFTASGATSLKYVAKYDTSTNAWTSLGGLGTDGVVNTMILFKNSIVIGGAFTKADTQTEGYKIARWDDAASSWKGILDTSNINNAPDGSVMSFHVFGDALYAGGSFTNGRGGNSNSSYRPLLFNGIARWNGTTWHSLGGGASHDVKTMAVSGDYLFAGGIFNNIGGVNATNVARMHLPTRTWESLNMKLEASWNNSSFNNEVRAVAASGNDVYVGGNFLKVNGQNAGGIVKWNASTKTWSTLGSGFTIGYASDGPYSIAIDGNDVIVGGGNIFGTSFVKKWNGVSWTDFPASLIKQYIYSMVIIGDTLFAAGTWGSSGSGAYLQKIHKSGSGSWVTVGPGGVGPNKLVYALAAGSDGSLYAAGDFAAVGTGGSQLITGGVAKYKNGVWSKIGQNIPSQATISSSGFRSVAVRGDTVIAGGSFIFTDSNGVKTDGLIIFDGARWNSIPTGGKNGVFAAAIAGTSAFIGGSFYGMGGTLNLRLAEFEFTGAGTGYAQYEGKLAGMNIVSPLRTPAIGSVMLSLKGNRATISGSFSGLAGTHSGSFIAIGKPGENGMTVQQLNTVVDNTGKIGSYGSAANDYFLSPEAVNDVHNGQVYVVIKSSSYPNGELRGQLLPAVNAAPAAAVIAQPSNAAMVTVGGSADSSVLFQWVPSADPNSNAVAYIWQFSRNATLDTLLYNANLGPVTQKKITFGELDAVLGFNGHAIGETKKYYFTVISSDGSLWTLGDTFSVNITRDSVKNIRFARLATITGTNSTGLLPTNGTAVMFGENPSGQLGVNEQNFLQQPAVVVFPNGVHGWKDIAVAQNHTLFLSESGDLYAAGDNSSGQLGNGSTSFAGQSVPEKVLYPDGVDTVTFRWNAIAAGRQNSFGIGNNHVLYGWGANGNGNLGTGDKTNMKKPTRVRMPVDADSASFSFVDIAAGYSHTVAVGNNGFVYEWGRQIGVQFPTDVTVPKKHFYPVGVDSTLVKFTTIVSGQYYAIAKADNGLLYGIGNNSQQQLGLGKTNSTNAVRLSRVQFPENVDTTTFRWNIVTAGYGHTLAIGMNGRLYAWGANNVGMLGTGTTTQVGIPTPTVMPSDIGGWITVSAGNYHSVAIGTNNRLYGWGKNNELQLGFASPTTVLAPTEFSNTLTSVLRNEELLPNGFSLEQNFPNPFNPSTTIRFTLSERGMTSLKVYDMIGREVTTLISEQLVPGTYDVRFNAASLSSGLYIYRLQSGSQAITRKMLFVK